jgi:hypothetical protein
VTSEKAKSELGYSPRSIQKSLADAVIWFREEAERRLGIQKVKNSFHQI